MHDLKVLLTKFKLNRYFIFFLIICIAAGSLIEMSLLFMFVMLHELCHVFFALAFKLKIKSIELFPFGGVARIEGLEGTGIFKEVMISVAGPAVNVTCALTIFLLDKAGVHIPYFRYIMDINIALALFNLMPGLPLDGGRILRAVLSFFIGFKKATQVAVICGRIVSVFLLLCGITAYAYGEINLSLLVIPVFVFVSAGKEESSIMYTIIKDVVGKNTSMKKKGIMETLELCAYEDTCAREVLKYFDLNRYHVIIVINAGMEVRAVLTESQVFNGLSLYGSKVTMGQLCLKYKK